MERIRRDCQKIRARNYQRSHRIRFLTSSPVKEGGCIRRFLTVFIWKHPHRTNRTCLFAPPVRFTAIMVKSRLLHFCLYSSTVQVSALCLAHRHSWILRGHSALALRTATAVLGRGSRCMDIPHSYILRTSNTPWCRGCRRHRLFHRLWAQVQNSTTRRNLLMRSGQATPSPLRGHLSRSMMSSSLATLPSVLSDQFYDTMEITIPTTMQVESASTEEPNTGALYGPGGSENIILRMESQELRIRSSISEETAHSEFKAMERDARCALFYQDQQFKIAVRETSKTGKIHRQSGCERIFRKWHNYDVARVSRLSQSIWRTNGKNERRVAQVIGSEAREALRGQRSHGLLEREVLFQAGEREKRVRKKPDALGAAVKRR